MNTQLLFDYVRALPKGQHPQHKFAEPNKQKAQARWLELLPMIERAGLPPRLPVTFKNGATLAINYRERGQIHELIIH